MAMRIWAVQAGETGEGLEIAYADSGSGSNDRALVFADTAEGYAQAFQAFKTLVGNRIGSNALYSFGEFGTDGRTEITAKGGCGDCGDPGCCDYPVDIVNLVAFEVIGA